jgi:hypothetical protein
MKTRKQATVDYARPTQDDEGRPVKGVGVYMTVTRVEKFVLPIQEGSGRTLGQFVDGMFTDIAKDGGRVSEIGFIFEPEQFDQLYREEYDNSRGI